LKATTTIMEKLWSIIKNGVATTLLKGGKGKLIPFFLNVQVDKLKIKR
jgi:hypothetical protein